MKDAKLTQHLKSGSYSRASRELYRYFPVVKKYVISHGGKTEDAEDIFQDALIILIKKMEQDSFVLTAAVDTLLFGIAKNLWFEELRKRNKIQAADIFHEVGERTAEISDLVVEELRIKKAYEALALLGSKCREILTLFYFKKWSMQKIAEKFGLGGETSAKNQKYRCLQKAKEIYLTLN